MSQSIRLVLPRIALASNELPKAVGGARPLIGAGMAVTAAENPLQRHEQTGTG